MYLKKHPEEWLPLTPYPAIPATHLPRDAERPDRTRLGRKERERAEESSFDMPDSKLHPVFIITEIHR